MTSILSIELRPLQKAIWRIEDLITNPPTDWLIEDHHTAVAVRKEFLYLYQQLLTAQHHYEDNNAPTAT